MESRSGTESYTVAMHWGGARTNSGGARENSGGARANAGGARANAGGARTNAGGPRENAGGVRKNAGGVRVRAGGSRPNAGRRPSMARVSIDKTHDSCKFCAVRPMAPPRENPSAALDDWMLNLLASTTPPVAGIKRGKEHRKGFPRPKVANKIRKLDRTTRCEVGTRVQRAANRSEQHFRNARQSLQEAFGRHSLPDKLIDLTKMMDFSAEHPFGRLENSEQLAQRKDLERFGKRIEKSCQLRDCVACQEEDTLGHVWYTVQEDWVVEINAKRALGGYPRIAAGAWLCRPCYDCYSSDKRRYRHYQTPLFKPVPPEIACLKDDENRSIAPGIAMVSVRVVRGGQSASKGNVINFKNDVQLLVDTLPHAKDVVSMRILRSDATDPEKLTYAKTQPVIRVGPVRRAMMWYKEHNKAVFGNLGFDDAGAEDLAAVSPDMEPAVHIPLNDHIFIYREEQDSAAAQVGMVVGQEAGTDAPGLTAVLPPLTAPLPENDPLVLAKCFPWLFPYGEAIPGGGEPTPTFQQHLLRYHDRRFQKEIQLIFWLHNLNLRKKIYRGMKHRQFVDNPAHRFTDAEMALLKRARVQELPKELIDKLHGMLCKVFPIMSKIPGTPSYMRERRNELLSLLTSPSMEVPNPSLFLSFSPADTYWPELAMIAYNLKSRSEVAEDMPYTALKENPVWAVRHFMERFDAFLSEIIMGEAKPFGTVVDYWRRTESQQRLSLHIHMLLWIKELQASGEWLEDEEKQALLRNYVDRCITAWNPTPEYRPNDKSQISTRDALREPADPSWDTSTPEGIHDVGCVVNSSQIHFCSDSCMKGNARTKRGVCRFHFPWKNLREETSLEMSTSEAGEKSLTVNIRRNDEAVNRYNAHAIRAWRGNMDVALLGSPLPIVYYTAKYISKADVPDVRALGNQLGDYLLRRATEEPILGTAWRTLQCVANRYVGAYQFGAQEAAQHILGIPIVEFSKSIVRVNALPDEKLLTSLNGQPSAVELFRQAYRTRSEEKMTLAEAYEHYKLERLPKDGCIECGDGLFLNPRAEAAAIVLAPYIAPRQEEDFAFAMLLLHVPWQNEDELIREGETAAETLEALLGEKDGVLSEESKLQIQRMQHMEQQGSKLQMAEQLPQHDDDEEPDMDEEVENAADDTQEMYLEPEVASLDEWTKAVTYIKRLKPKAADETRGPGTSEGPPLGAFKKKLLENLDDEQLAALKVLDEHMRKHEACQMIIRGPAGAGKSRWIEMASRLAEMRYPTGRVRRWSYTGTAAAGIDGETLHSGLLFGRKTDDYDLSKLTAALAHVVLIIIDEFSMISATRLSKIEERLRSTRATKELRDKPWGGYNVVFLGDFRQLPPPTESPLYKAAPLCWQRIANVVNFTQLHRFSEDRQWGELLSRLRLNKQTDDDIAKLNTRVVSAEAAPDPSDNCLWVAARYVKGVNDYNLLHHNRTPGDAVRLKARLSTEGGGREDSNERSSYFKVNGRVMITSNLCTTAGLVNGAMGTLVGVKRHPKTNKLMAIVKVDDGYFKAPRSFEGMPNCIALIGGKNNAIWLKAGYACTIHKSQGKTLDRIVIDPRLPIALGMLYVALSRATTMNGVHLLAPVDHKMINSHAISEAGIKSRTLIQIEEEEARLQQLAQGTGLRHRLDSARTYWETEAFPELNGPFIFPSLNSRS